MNGRLLFHTILHLRFRQIAGRILQKSYHPQPRKHSLPIRRQNGAFLFPAFKKGGMKSVSSFRFLNKEFAFDELNFWNDSRCNALWLYNLHYFDWLNAPESTVNKSSCEITIYHWIESNIVGKGVGWDSYPISLRSVNWIKWHLNGNLLSPSAQNSLALQIRYLNNRLENHLLANHLFANAKALVFGGLYFSGAEADCWLKKGVRILEKELHEQILEDGGNYERSPMYHAIMLEDLLDLAGLFKMYQHVNVTDSFKTLLSEKITGMLRWLSAMCHNDGKIALFNDAAFNIAPEYKQLVTYANLLGVSYPECKKQLHDLSKTGYVSYRGANYTMIIDAGEVGPTYQPGHAHADTLSFELSKASDRIIVDSGTSCYGVSNERLRQRKTPAHNTLSIDGCDSSEVWSGFRVARRAGIVERIVTENDNSVVIKASHNGFKRLRRVGVHRRTWTLKENSVVILDEVKGGGKHTVDVFMHFHPDVLIRLVGSECSVLSDEKVRMKIVLDDTLDVRVADATYHPEFGIEKQNKQLIMTATAELPFQFKTEIVFLQ